MIAAIRLRGPVAVSARHEMTMKMLKLTRVNTMVILPENPSVKGMLHLVGDFITWGEISKEVEHKFHGKTVNRLKPAKRGLKSIKYRFPKGDLGYRGSSINLLIEKMM